MRVVANLSFVVPGAVGGSEEYSVRLLDAVRASDDSGIDLAVAGSSALFNAYPRLAPAGHLSFRGPAGLRAYRAAVESTWLTRVTSDAALVHHFGGRLPSRRTARTVVTVHDIQPLDMPHNFSPLKRRYLEWALPRTVNGADMICTPSRWVADRLIERMAADPERVRVVSSTSNPGRIRGPVAPEVAVIGDRPLVLYPAITHPHKNHSVLLTAMHRVVREHPDAVLVLTGGSGRAHDEVLTQARRLDPDGLFIRHLGRVAASTLAELTARADVVAFPSLYEGFGLPVLEAMHRGTPVVAADATALPEVLGGAGVLVAPDDSEAWGHALSALLGDDERRAGLAVAGTARAASYSVEGAARTLTAAWRDVAA